MAIIKIPVRSDLPAYSFTIELEGARYLMRFRYNERAALWFMDIAETDGTDIVAGVPLQTNVGLFDRFPLPALPPGRFLAYDESGNAADADDESLGANVVLLYQEADDS